MLKFSAQIVSVSTIILALFSVAGYLGKLNLLKK